MSLSRRSWLSAMLALTAAGAVRPGRGAPRPQQLPAPRQPTPRPVSMAMHIHGSFSEGIASYEAHLEQARQHGVDVIWWTDHDFRVAAHHYRREVRFDGFSEREDGLEWHWSEERDGDVAWGSAEFVTRREADAGLSRRSEAAKDLPRRSESNAALPRRSESNAGLSRRSESNAERVMRLVGRGGRDGGALWYRATAWNWTYSRTMADTTMELDVLAEETGPGRELLFEIHASYHPARHGRPAGQYLLQYRIGGSDTPSRRADGLLGIVELPAPRGVWHGIRLRPVDDIKAIWPDLVAEDNSSHQLRVGVSVRSDAETRATIDTLRFDRGRGVGESAIELRRSVLARYRDEYADVAHYEAFEVSLVRHLNWFGGELMTPELVSPPYRNNDPDLAEEMVAFMHAQGALVQWNHPLDVETPESLVRLMIERNNLGADIVEIGRPPFDELRRVLDAAARNAVFFTAVGVSDDHDGRNWLSEPRNRITYVWAESTAMADLTAALRAGRAWWTNAARWRGTLDIEVGGRSVLGAVLVAPAETVTVRLAATGVPAGGALEIIESPVDYAGPDDPTPATRSQRLPAHRLRNGAYDHTIQPGNGSYVRLQVRDQADEIVGESNPFWMLRQAPPHGIPEARRFTP